MTKPPLLFALRRPMGAPPFQPACLLVGGQTYLISNERASQTLERRRPHTSSQPPLVCIPTTTTTATTPTHPASPGYPRQMRPFQCPNIIHNWLFVFLHSCGLETRVVLECGNQLIPHSTLWPHVQPSSLIALPASLLHQTTNRPIEAIEIEHAPLCVGKY